MTSKLDAHTEFPGNGRIVVLYHHPCADGVCAALCAWLFFRTTLPDREVVYKGHRTWERLSFTFMPTDTVILCDYVGPAKWARDLASRVYKIIVLDHHKTGLEPLLAAADTLPANMDVSHSTEHLAGARIALDYFSALTSKGQLGGSRTTHNRVSMLVAYVADQDLWTFAIPLSRPFGLGLASLGLEYDYSVNPTIFSELADLDMHFVIGEGKKLAREMEARIVRLLRDAVRVRIGDVLTCYGVVATPANNNAVVSCISELGHRLAERSKEEGDPPVGAVVLQAAPGMREGDLKISLRSTDGFDTTPIAKTYGGGGHPGASGFVVASRDFEAWQHTSSL